MAHRAPLCGERARRGRATRPRRAPDQYTERRAGRAGPRPGRQEGREEFVSDRSVGGTAWALCRRGAGCRGKEAGASAQTIDEFVRGCGEGRGAVLAARSRSRDSMNWVSSHTRVRVRRARARRDVREGTSWHVGSNAPKRARDEQRAARDVGCSALGGLLTPGRAASGPPRARWC